LSTDNRPTYFINAGLSGTGPVEYSRILATIGLKYHPDLVLIVLSPNDVTNTVPGSRTNVVKRGSGEYAVVDPQLLWEPRTGVRRVARTLWPWSYTRLQVLAAERDKEALKDLGFVEGVKQRARRTGISEARIREWEASIPPAILEACNRNEFNQSLVAMGCLHPDAIVTELDLEGESGEQSWATMRQVLTEIVQICREAQAGVGIVYIPTSFQYDERIGTVRRTVGVQIRPGWLTELSSELERRLVQWAGDARVPFLSLLEDLRTEVAQSAEILNFPLDEHLNTAGHRVVAGSIRKWLIEQELLAPSHSDDPGEDRR
jgi:hypothetical protein